jgi:hypothetical protein
MGTNRKVDLTNGNIGQKRMKKQNITLSVDIHMNHKA